MGEHVIIHPLNFDILYFFVKNEFVYKAFLQSIVLGISLSYDDKNIS